MPLPQRSSEYPEVEKTNFGSFGSGKVSFVFSFSFSRSFAVGFRLIEFAILTVRLVDLSFDMLDPLHIDSVEGVLILTLDMSEGADIDVFSGMLSGMRSGRGVLTGIGRSTDNLDPTAIGIGMLSDSFNGLTGESRYEAYE